MLTLGFDTRFQMRTLTRVKVGEGDKILVIRVDEQHERADAAERDLVRFAKEILGTGAHVLRVNVHDPREAIPAIASKLSELSGSAPPAKVVVDLSGGMRALILETLAAVLNLFPPDAVDIVVWTEDLKEMVSLTPRSFSVPRLDDLSARILDELSDGVPRSLKELTSAVGRPRTTVYHRLRGLLSDGLVREVRRLGTALHYAVTDAGLLALRLFKALRR